MKVVYFERYIDGLELGHVHAGVHTKCFYIPSKDLALFSEKSGTFGSTEYGLATSEKLLKEARAIAEDMVPIAHGISYNNIKVFEYDGVALRALIRNAKAKTKLERKVESGIKELLKCVGEK